jgi:hypothetical protein
VRRGWWKQLALWGSISFLGGIAFAVQLAVRNEVVLDERALLVLASMIFAFAIIGGTLITLIFELLVFAHRLWERQRSN